MGDLRSPSPRCQKGCGHCGAAFTTPRGSLETIWRSLLTYGSRLLLVVTRCCGACRSLGVGSVLSQFVWALGPLAGFFVQVRWVHRLGSPQGSFYRTNYCGRLTRFQHK
jgi:hypothetical protein